MNKTYVNCRTIFSFLFLLLILVSCIQPEAKRYADGMLRIIPENEGVGSHNILDFVEEIDNQGLELHSFMFLRRGRVLAEGYWSPYKADINHIMNSVSKTFTSTAIGFAVKEKLLTVNDKVISFFPDDLPATISPNLEKLTVKHLLTMTVGQENPPVFSIADDNWAKMFLATPIIHEPGKTFLYNTSASYMLSAIIQKVSGKSMFDYLKPRLFDPLEIEGASWETDPRGITCGGWGLRIKTGDMAKFGKFYQQNGKWNRKQLLPESWIKEATSVHIYQVEEPTFEQEMYDEGAQGYGYQIWRSTHNSYRADGANGQLIVVMPDQEAVLITTGRVADMRKILTLFWEHLFPGIIDRKLRLDDAAREALLSKLVSLQVKYPFRSDDAVSYAQNTTRSFKIEANDSQFRNVSFQFDEYGRCTMNLTIGTSSYPFDFGLDSWRYSETEKLSPYFLNPRRNPAGLPTTTTAGYASWTNKDELQLRLTYLTDIESETYVCKFDGDKIEINISNSMQPEHEALKFTGNLK